MHPEVITDKPGKCPKCKMDLVPKESGGGLRAKKAEVTLGASNGDRAVVLSGLREGDKVVVDGGADLHEGDALFQTEWGIDGPKEMPPPPGMEKMGDMPGMDHKKDAGKTDSMPGMDMGGQGGSGKTDDMHDMDMKHEDGGGEMENMHGMDMGKKEAVKKQPAPAKAGGVVYACPMHPEVKSDKPGSCPKCGMDLVPGKK